MSAETLREAAQLMRERAEASTGLTEIHGRAGWDAYVLGSEGYAVMGAPREGRRMRTFVARCGMNDWDTDKQNAEHIASWHPAVALAVAEWITAHLDTHSPTTDDCDWTDRYVAGGECAALAVARAYLGETS